MVTFFEKEKDALRKLVKRYAIGLTKEALYERPLFKMLMSMFNIPYYAPQWFKQISEDLKKDEKMKIYGGGQKDIIFSGANVITFTTPPYPRTFVTNLQAMIRELNTLPKPIQERVNYPLSESDVYEQKFTTVNQTTRSSESTTVVATRIERCLNSDLEQWRPQENPILKVHYFATAVYELVKVCRFLNNSRIFLLDIKPANIFVCQKGNQQVFQFGDVDYAYYCGYADCKSVTSAYTDSFITFGLKKAGKNEEAFRMRDCYALIKSLLIVMKQWMNSSNRPLDEVATFALSASLRNPLTTANYQKTAEQLNAGLTAWTLGTWSKKNRDQFVKGKTQDQVLQSLKELLNAMMQALWKLSKGPVDDFGVKVTYPEEVDTWMKKIQTLAKACGAKRFDAKMKVERLRKFLNREVEEDAIFMEGEDNMLNMSSTFEEMGVCWKGYRRNSKPRYSKGSCVKVKRGRRRRRRFQEELKF